MRYVKYLFLLVVAVAAVLLAIANRGPVTLRLLPEGVSLPGVTDALPTQVTLPIYLAMFAAVFIGLLVGLVLELLRERDHRRAERQYRKEAQRLDAERKRLLAKAGEEDDDILGLSKS